MLSNSFPTGVCLLQLTGKEPELRVLRLKGAPFPLEEMFPEDVYNNISILALMAKQPFVRWMYKCAKEGDEKTWKRQVIERHWLCDETHGRQFFFTEQEWMGVSRPCNGPKVGNGQVSVTEGSGVKVGDVLAILAGSERVWILRQDETGVYAIVGQAYVYGLSEGKGFDAKILLELRTMRIK